MQRVCAEHEAELPETAIVAHGAQSAVGHEEGSGPIERGEVVLIDIWPRDKASRCWADMTRTFVAGGEAPPAELQEYWELTRASLDAVDGGDPPRRGLPRAARALLRAVRGGGQADGAHQGAGHRAGRGLLPRPRARGRARGPRAPEPRPLRREADRGRRRDGRAGLLPARASGASGWRTCCSSPRTAARSSRTFRTTSRRRRPKPAGAVASLASRDPDRARPAPARQGQGPRDVRPRGRPADGRLRPHLDLRRRASDADSGQGPRADRPVRALVRPHGIDRPEPLRLRHRRRAGGPARPRAARAAAGDAAGRVRRARLHRRARAGRTTSAPARSRACSCRRACASPTGSRSRSTPRRPRPTWATTRRSTSSRPSS